LRPRGLPLTRRGVVLAGAGLATGLAVVAARAEKPGDLPLGARDIRVNARPLAAFRFGSAQTRFGALEWVGGFELTSPEPAFGGLSGLAWLDGEGTRALMISDAGIWFETTFTADGSRLTGIARTRMAPMRDAAGRSVAGTWRGDAESVAIRGTEVFVGYEGTNEIRRFPLRPDVLDATPTQVPVPQGVKGLRRSRGLEALALFPAGTRFAGQFLAVAESPVRDEGGYHRAFILSVGGEARAFRIVHRDDFHVTDAVVLPSGEALLLERRVNLPFGVWCRLRRIAADALGAGTAPVDGRVIFEADLSHAIDNMEGLALHQSGGRAFLTMVSDDNYNMLQRTLLLRFRLVE
jgi:hypothetical protein